jgi:GT2 family glycosyltransferase
MDLSVIIVSYNVKYFLEQCLSSVEKAIAPFDAEVLVIDNASSDGSITYLSPLFPRVKFIANPQNDGFSKANNKALQDAAGRYILFLNPDTVLPEDSLQKCIQFMERHPDAGALGVRMVNGDGIYLKESKRGFPSPLTSFFKLSGLCALFPHSKIFARYYLGHLNENSSHEVDVLSGAFFFTRKEVLDKTGGFDERFFMYAEDIDLSYRIQQAGYKNYYFAGTTILHYKGESTNHNSLQYTKHFYKAMSQFVQKHYSGKNAALYTIVIQAGILIRGFVAGIGNLLGKLRD